MKVLPGERFVVVVIFCALYSYVLWTMGKAWFWKRAIRRFEQSDLREPPQRGVIVFTGSSSIRFWKSLAQDMAPLKVVNRGFGGSHMEHVTHYAPRIVLPYSPDAVVVYAGENDLSWPWRKTPESILHDFQEFVDLVHGHQPTTWVYFISIKPTPARWRQWKKQRRTNEIIDDFCRTKAQVQFVDVSHAMLGSGGKPRRNLFKWDGFAPLCTVLRPVEINHPSDSYDPVFRQRVCGSARHPALLLTRQDPLARRLSAFLAFFPCPPGLDDGTTSG